MKLGSLSRSMCLGLFAFSSFGLFASDVDFESTRFNNRILADGTHGIYSGLLEGTLDCDGQRVLFAGANDDRYEPRVRSWDRITEVVFRLFRCGEASGDERGLDLSKEENGLRLESDVDETNFTFLEFGQRMNELVSLFFSEHPWGEPVLKFSGSSLGRFQLPGHLNPLEFGPLGLRLGFHRPDLCEVKASENPNPGNKPSQNSQYKRDVVDSGGSFEEFEHWMMAFSALICGLGVGFAIGVWYACKSSSENSLANV